MANVRMPRSQLTFSQQGQVRANLMRSASAIASQLQEYIEAGFITVAGKEVTMTTERLQAYRLVLSKTVPDLSSTEITHKSGLEGMDSGQLVTRLAQLAQARPELREKLYEALGGRLIEVGPAGATEVHDAGRSPKPAAGPSPNDSSSGSPAVELS